MGSADQLWSFSLMQFLAHRCFLGRRPAGVTAVFAGQCRRNVNLAVSCRSSGEGERVRLTRLLMKCRHSGRRHCTSASITPCVTHPFALYLPYSREHTRVVRPKHAVRDSPLLDAFDPRQDLGLGSANISSYPAFNIIETAHDGVLSCELLLSSSCPGGVWFSPP